MAQHVVANSSDKHQSLPGGLQSGGDLTHSAASRMGIHCTEGAFPKCQHSWTWPQITTCLPASTEIKLSLSSFKLSHNQQGQKQEDVRIQYIDLMNELKSAAQDKPRTRVPALPDRWLQNPALSIGPDVLKPIVGGMPPCKPQMSLLQSSLGPVKAKHRLTQNPPVDLEPWIHAEQPPSPTPLSQMDFSKHLPSASSEQTREHAAQPSPLFLHTNPPHDLVSPRPSVTAKHPQSPELTAGRETPNQGRRAFARGGEDGWGGGEERREGNNLHSQGKKLKLGQILH